MRRKGTFCTLSPSFGTAAGFETGGWPICEVFEHSQSEVAAPISQPSIHRLHCRVSHMKTYIHVSPVVRSI